GTVPDRWMKRMAEDLVENCSGVKQVHNRLRVKARDEGGPSGGGSSSQGGSFSQGGSTASMTQGASGSSGMSGTSGSAQGTGAAQGSGGASEKSSGRSQKG